MLVTVCQACGDTIPPDTGPLCDECAEQADAT